MNFLLIAIAGVIGTTAMMAIMHVIHRFKWANADMVRAIGSIYTRSYEMSFLPGIIIHYGMGIFFAYLYAMLIGVAPIATPATIIIIASAAGLVHGIIIGLLLEVAVAEHHPLRQFRQTGFRVVVAHIIGHQVYGTTLGIFFALMWSKIQPTIENFVQGNVISDLIGYSFIWLPLFGIPILFISYLTYFMLAADFRSKAKNVERKNGKPKKQPRKAA